MIRPPLLRRAVGVLTLLLASQVQAQMRITEFMYSAANGEVIEFTNIGSTPVDMTGWSYDDSTRVAGTVSLSGFGTVAPGESVILTETTADAFRTAWGLCAASKVIGGNPSADQLGRNDEINLYDAGNVLVDRLSFGDQNFPGTIRTQDTSGVPNATGVDPGVIVNDVSRWVFSQLGDTEPTRSSAAGNLGSPGRSAPARAAVAFDPCPPQVRITEYMYDGTDGEFIEITNLGAAAVDLAGWSFDDNSRAPDSTPIGALGTLAPGESAIITSSTVDAFRAAWGLCPAAKILGSNANNLGREDEINLYDASDTLHDRLTYGDQTFAPGTIRTSGVSGRVAAAGLGDNEIAQWLLSSVADVENSYAATAGNIGSPARSRIPQPVFEPCPPPPPPIRITEYMYSGAGGEFVEFTNVGLAAIDMAGWSFSDAGRTPGAVDLSAFGNVQPGESVILTEDAAAAFRDDWNLCDGVKVIGGNTVNLGNGDEINLYDAGDAQVDRLTYPNGGPPLANGASAWVPAAALGQNAIAQWVLSTLGDAEASVASVPNDIGRPGRSERRAVDFDACVGLPGAPTVQVDPATTSPRLELPANGSGSASGVIGDPTDPAATTGIGFALADTDGDVAMLSVTAASSDAAVVAASGLTLEGSGAARVLRIVPAGAGYATITVRAVDTDNKVGTYTIRYAASAASAQPATTRFHTGASDASTALALDSDWMLVADDENQLLRLYPRDLSGLHVVGFDFTTSLGLTDIDDGAPREVDIEGSTRVGSRIYWSGSHGNQATGNNNARPNRRRIFATDISGAGAGSTLAYAGRYDHLVADLVAWDSGNGHGLGANALGFAAATAPNVSPEIATGFNIEALAAAGDDAYLGFRAPLIAFNGGLRALVVPVLGLDALVTGAAPGSRPAGAASFGAPILLDLGGRAIRSMERSADGRYLIVAGPAGAVGAAPNDFRLFVWSGAADAPAIAIAADLAVLSAGGSFESIVHVPAVLEGAMTLQLAVDNGDFVYYGDGIAAKDLAEPRARKFRTERVEVTVPGDTVFANGFEDDAPVR